MKLVEGLPRTIPHYRTLQPQQPCVLDEAVLESELWSVPYPLDDRPALYTPHQGLGRYRPVSAGSCGGSNHGSNAKNLGLRRGCVRSVKRDDRVTNYELGSKMFSASHGLGQAGIFF